MTTTATTTSSPQEFTIYLPKKARKSANVDLGPGLNFDMIKEIAPDKYNEMIQGFKKDPPDNMVYVDVYKDNIVYFECYKAIEAIKKAIQKKHGFPIVIKKVVITDTDSVHATHINNTIEFAPCGIDGDEDYPATYTFDNPI